jgi:hypothetical protein
MLVRKIANLNKYEEINADIEIEFTADSGSSTVIPLGKDWHTVGVQLSGGLDSALLLFLTAKAIEQSNLNIRIQPISVFIPTKVKNIAATDAIIDKVRELTGVNFINDGLIFDMPIEETSTIDGKKDQFFVNMIRDLFHNGKINFEFNGNTKNPPTEARVGWKNDEFRQKNRDNASSIYTTSHSASPHYNMDKGDIINLYIKYDLLDAIAPLTCSCDENISVVHRNKTTVPCGTCWWCEERKYGFDSNNIDDPATVLSYEEYLEVPYRYKTT